MFSGRQAAVMAGGFIPNKRMIYEVSGSFLVVLKPDVQLGFAGVSVGLGSSKYLIK